jgi:anti-anti-sigma regulatory factor
VLELTSSHAATVHCLSVDCTAIDDVDFTAGEMLVEVAATLRSRDVRLLVANVSDHVRQDFDSSGVTDALGRDAYLNDLLEARGVCDGSHG